jgi:hypothetical protein
VEGFSNFFFNLSAGLMAATAARAWASGLDLVALAWLFGAIGLLLLGSGLLYLLEPEDKEMGDADR